MLIKLIREAPKGDAIFGRLDVDNNALVMDTLENWQYAIPAGFYRLRLTYSPRFKELLPLLYHVLGYARDKKNGVPRTGIRIHAGNTITDTTGCILVGSIDEASDQLVLSRKHLDALCEKLYNYQTMYPYEEIYIDIREPDPYPNADVECPHELQQHVIDAQAARERYYRQFREERSGSKESRTGDV